MSRDHEDLQSPSVEGKHAGKESHGGREDHPHASELPKGEALEPRRLYLTAPERRYYLQSYRQCRQSAQLYSGISVMLVCAHLILLALMSTKTPYTRWQTASVFFLSFGAMAFLLTVMLSLWTHVHLSHFFRYFATDFYNIDKSLLLSPLYRGHAARQAALVVCLAGLASSALFLFAHLAQMSFLWSLLLCVSLGIFWGWWKSYQQKFEDLSQFKGHLDYDAQGQAPTFFIQDETEEKKIPMDEQLLLEGLSMAMKNRSPRVRIAAIKSLGKLEHPERVSRLLPALKDEFPEVRARALLALASTGEPVLLELLNCLLADEAPEVRVAAADGLARLKDKRVSAQLIDLLDDGVPEVRGAAAEALGDLSVDKAAKQLLSRAQDPDWFVRYKAILALAKLKVDLSPGFIEALAQATRDSHEYVRMAAQSALKKIAEDLTEADPYYTAIGEILSRFPGDQQQENPANAPAPPAAAVTDGTAGHDEKPPAGDNQP